MNRNQFQLITLLTFVVLLSGCMKPGHRFCTFAVKKGDKTYVYSSLGKFITQGYLDDGEAPPLLQQMGLVVDDGKYYVDPAQMKDIVTVLSGNYEILERKEKSYDGYLVEGEGKVYKKKYTSQSTEQIGKMQSIVKVTLTNLEGTRSHVIKWERGKKVKAIENCEVRKIKFDRSYRPGEQVITWESNVVVPLEDLINFYDPKIKVEYDPKGEVIYFNMP